MSTVPAWRKDARHELAGHIAPPVVEVSSAWNDLLFTTTAEGNWSACVAAADPLATGEYNQLVTVRADAILQYECAILRLRQEVMHYKRLLSQILSPTASLDEYGQPQPVIPLNAASTRVLNSVLAARVADSAVFREFGDEEL